MRKKTKAIGGDPKDHLANERTFLAWIRTCVGLMAFGFVIEKFSFFILKFSTLSEQSIAKPLQKASSLFGISLITIGAFICFLSFIDYRNIRKQIENGCYQPSNVLNIVTMLSVIIIGSFLIFSIINGIL